MPLSSAVGVIIPAYNEERMVGTIVSEVRALGFPVVVVDDASTDATACEAEKAGALVMTLPLRAGAWGATQAGIRHALHAGWQCIITMDADGQHTTDSLPALLAAAPHADVIIGSCPERASRLRHVAWALFRLLGNVRVRDITSGLRVYNRRAARFTLSAKGMLADFQDVAILLLLQSAKLHICEIPVAMRPRADGKSRIFYSWGRVMHYMACTLLLACARRCRVFKVV